MNLFHGLEERCRREPRWRFCYALLNMPILIGNEIPFADAWQMLRLVSIILCIMLFFLIEHAPSVLQNDFSACRKNFFSGSDFNFRREEFLRWIKLCDVSLCDERIKILLHLFECVIVRSYRCWDDGMMCGDFCVVPCTAPELSIRLYGKGRKICVKGGEMIENEIFVCKLVLRQIVAVRARIACEFLFIKCLLCA